MAQVYLAVTIITLLAVTHGISAKRGCSAFGHSCFGGHGKRSNDNSVEQSNQELVARNQLGQEEIPPHPVYPHTGYSSILSPGDDIIPIRDGGASDQEDTAVRDVLKMKLRNIFKHWMDVYRRSQQTSGEGYFNENL